LGEYSTLLDAQAAKKTLSESAVNYLKSQAAIVIAELNKL
jgi:hypothetical protein